MEHFKAGFFVNQGHYKSFQPNKINQNWTLRNMEVIKLLSEADRMLGRLDMYSEHVPNIDLFIGMHILKEATLSAKIEGTQTSMEEALLPEESIPLDKRDDWTEVQNYIEAMNEAVVALDKLPFSSRLVRQTHKRLLQGVRGKEKLPGEFRRSQNWIGGYNIDDAIFVPPTHTSIPELMDDIDRFVHNEQIWLPDLLKIGLIHYQFETIHPFLDGNGRVGRLMITLYLVSKGILKRPILYLSDYLERHRNSYYSKMMDVRTKDKIDDWLIFFLKGVIETAKSGVNTFEKILQLQKQNEELIKKLRHRSAKALIVLTELYRNPVIDANKVVNITQTSTTTANSLLNDLIELGIIEETTGGKRGRTYRMEKYLALFE